MTYRLYSFIGGFILHINYSDNSLYYSTDNINSIRNFFKVIGSVSKLGNVSDEQAARWYQLDKLDGLTD